MHIRPILSALLLLTPAAALAQPLGPIWQHGRDAVLVTPCPKGGEPTIRAAASPCGTPVRSPHWGPGICVSKCCGRAKPVRWVESDFAVDLAALQQPLPSQRDLAFRQLAIREELSRWANDAYPAKRLYPPEAPSGTPLALRALAELMLSGHADDARALLHASWPKTFGDQRIALPGEEDFWRALCRAVVRHPLWRALRLDRLPHANIITANAALGRSS